MITEAIILAGGLGTRLRSVVPELPKCMAPVAGKPFVGYIIDRFLGLGINHFVFSLGYRHEVITQWLDETYPDIEKTYVIESEPLGTGGGISLAISKTKTGHPLILNGDTYFDVNTEALLTLHLNRNSLCTLALKSMTEFDRYGVVTTDHESRVTSFLEKQFYAEGTINGGVYLLNKTSFQSIQFPEKYSFEKDFLEKYYSSQPVYGSIQEGYFIDIGIPSDFEKAQTEMPLQNLPR